MKRILDDKLRILSSLDSITSDYSLGWGSLLGYARGGRIIPWDDDVDVIMEWETYKKLSSEYPDRFFWYKGTLRYTDGQTKIEVSKESRWVPNYIDVFIMMQHVTPDIKTKMQRWINCSWKNFKNSTWMFRIKNLKYYLLRPIGDWKYLQMVKKYAEMPKQDKRFPLSSCFIFGKDFILNCPFDTEEVIFNGVKTRAIKSNYLNSLLTLNYGKWRIPVSKPLHNCIYRIDGKVVPVFYDLSDDITGIERDLMIVQIMSRKHITSYVQLSDAILFFAPYDYRYAIDEILSKESSTSIHPVYYMKRSSY